jgi:hypothetical protein
MTEYIKGKDGKFAGSIGDGKTHVPTAAPVIASAPAAEIVDPTPSPVEAMFAKYADRTRLRDAARASWYNVSDSILETNPESTHIILDENDTPIRIEGRDGLVVWDHSEYPLADDMLADVATWSAGKDKWDLDREYKATDGTSRLTLLHKCPEDGCNFRYGSVGWYPRHDTPAGHSAHCTCDSCF